MTEQYRRGALTLRGLMRRMARMADNGRVAWVQQRLAALRWVAAVATRLGGACLQVQGLAWS